MDSVEYADLYDTHYFATGCGRPYKRDKEWLNLFDGIAKQIVDEINPQSVLDAGCALGFLVEGLRKHNVNAFGIDISEYAIENVHSDIKSYCRLGSVADPFPRRYDLIICIEVLEHMPKDEAKRAIANFCRHSDDILFSSTPFDYKEVTHFNVQTLDKWVEEFARHGFFRDVDFDASFITFWAIRFRRVQEPVARVVAAYERRFWELLQENQARRELSLEQRNELAGKEQALQQLRRDLETQKQQINIMTYRFETVQDRWSHLEDTVGWKIMLKLQNSRARLMPPGSVRDLALGEILRALQTRQVKPFFTAMDLVSRDISQRIKSLRGKTPSPTKLHDGLETTTVDDPKTITVNEVQPRPSIQPHRATVDIVICVRNALVDVQWCLESVVEHTISPYSLILIDDGSDLPTRNYLSDFAQSRGAVLLRNEIAAGYTLAANQGLHSASADYIILLNSDTVVTPGWLDRLIACAESNPKIGLVGPLSNAATWQSIPEILDGDEWVANTLPVGITINHMGATLAQYAPRLYPTVPFLNGFCLLIKKEVIEQVGYFDEENFGVGYGEENDYCLRARQAGWLLGLADDAYIYHAGSKSYSPEQREQLADVAGKTLVEKHGVSIVEQGVTYSRYNRVLEGIRAYSRTMLERQTYIEKGRVNFSGKRVLFLLPVMASGGGGLMVVLNARIMRQMGVQADILNLKRYQEGFEQSYPALDVPVIFGDAEDIPDIASQYDALIATENTSVQWLASALSQNSGLIHGYFIQDFEPYFHAPDSKEFETAWYSYSFIPNVCQFTTTEWVRQEVLTNIGVDSSTVGASFDADLFRPRPRSGPEWPDRPLRVAAMIRPESQRRAPGLTMEVLQWTAKRFGDQVDIRLFGTEQDNPAFLALPHKFNWRVAGKLSAKQMANFLNDVDIFVDFSSHQALGLTALEAMACGLAVVVPTRGGTNAFAQSGGNCLVVDTASPEACREALWQLIEDHDLRTRLQRNAIYDACAFYPEKQAFNILNTLFVRNKTRSL